MAAHRLASVPWSRWLPTATVGSVVLSLLLATGTSLGDVLAFAAYAVICLVVPGTLLWRRLRPIESGSRLEDVVFGTIFGYAVEIPTYLAARAVDLPHLVLAWPLLVYADALLTRRGRAGWIPLAVGTRVPAAWAWVVAGVTMYLVLFVTRASWWVTSVAGPGLRDISPDGAFSLALTGELRHHVPPGTPWLAGEPLHYHWFTYAHLASATWVTGVEPIVMLRRLAPLLMAVVTVLAVYALVHRLTKRPPLAALGAGLMVVLHSPAFYAAESDHFQRQEYTSPAIFGSPTMTFGSMLFAGALLLILAVLGERVRASTWLVLGLLLATTFGTKATFAPMTASGTLGVLVVASLVRGARREHLALAALAVGLWLSFQLGFYGGNANAASLTPRGTFDFAATSFGARLPETLPAAVALATVILLLWSVRLAGLLGLLTNGGWRTPRWVFIWAFTGSGLGASLLLDLAAASQQWFINSTHVPAAVGASVGLGRLWPTEARTRAPAVAAIALLLALTGSGSGWLASPVAVPSPGPTVDRLWAYAAPFLLTVSAIAIGALAAHAVRERIDVQRAGLIFLVVGLTALGLFRTVQVSTALARVPWQSEAVPGPSATQAGQRGVEAARWLRSASASDDLVATNAHTLTPTSELTLAFWLAGYAERRVLVESWGYTARHARIMAETGSNYADTPFWDSTLLDLNDAAFVEPTPGTLKRLRANHGVDWLVLDRRFPSNAEALSAIIPPAYERGDYVVYDLAAADLS